MTIYHLPKDVRNDLFPETVLTEDGWTCFDEFGPHSDHSMCDWTFATMNDPYANYDETDYSDWYGGERGYNDGLRWSDFI